jgi:hypothetical protein
MTVVLDKEYRTDDVQRIVDAIQMTRGVAEVELGEVVAGFAHQMPPAQQNEGLPKKSTLS